MRVISVLVAVLLAAGKSLAASPEAISAAGNESFLSPLNFTAGFSPAGTHGSSAQKSSDGPVKFAAFGPEWSENFFVSADGARIYYRFRAGDGPALLIIHGRGIGADGFGIWANNLFPGRAVMILERRGYGLSAFGTVDDSNIYDLNSSDIRQAIETTRALCGGQKVAIISYSLGSMLLPSLDSGEIAWLGLINPGVFGMLGQMDAEKTAASYSILTGNEASQFWLPPARAAWIVATADDMVNDLVSKLNAQSNGQTAGLVNSLIQGIRAKAKDLAWQELLIEETLWALYGTHRDDWDAKIPVFIGAAQSDEIVPQQSYDALASNLKERHHVEFLHMPGSHLSALFEPNTVLSALADFDSRMRAPAETVSSTP